MDREQALSLIHIERPAATRFKNEFHVSFLVGSEHLIAIIGTAAVSRIELNGFIVRQIPHV